MGGFLEGMMVGFLLFIVLLAWLVKIILDENHKGE